jgi:short-subunit dehydrogenase
MTEATSTTADFCRRYGPWAIVTGASSGLGEGFAHALGARGLHLILVARRLDELKRVASDVERNHAVSCVCVSVDLADADFIDVIEDAARARDIGLVVSNAAYNPAGAFEQLDRAGIDRMLAVNARATVLLAEAFSARLRNRGRGGLLFVASVEAYVGMPYSTLYSATKAFVLSFGEALWGEHLRSGVDVLVLVPGPVDTPLLASRKVRSRGMAPRAVAEIGLDNLSRGPSVVPGAGNRWATRLMRTLPRRWVVRLAEPALRKMVSRLHREP